MESPLIGRHPLQFRVFIHWSVKYRTVQAARQIIFITLPYYLTQCHKFGTACTAIKFWLLRAILSARLLWWCVWCTAILIKFYIARNATTATDHDDVMSWNVFPYHYPSVSGIHWWPVDSPHERPVMWTFDVFFDVSMITQLVFQWLVIRGTTTLMWRHYNARGGGCSRIDNHIQGRHIRDNLNSLRLTNVYMRLKTRPSLVQIMACRLFGTKPLSEPVQVYCQFDP